MSLEQAIASYEAAQRINRRMRRKRALRAIVSRILFVLHLEGI